MVNARVSQQGMTLLELLLAVAILAVVLGMGLGILTSAQQLWFYQQERMIAARQGWIWAQRICRDIRMAIPPAELGGGAEWLGTDARATFYDALPPPLRVQEMKEEYQKITVGRDSVRFPIARLKGREGPGMTEYALRWDEERGAVGIVRRTAPRGTPWSQAQEELVNDHAVSLDVEYLGADGKWRSEWKDRSATPSAVRVTVGTLLRRSRRVYDVMRFSTLVYLPAGSRISR